jgi:hypothetical protein
MRGLFSDASEFQVPMMDSERPLDLFGKPFEKRGRPRKAYSAEIQSKIDELHLAGLRQTEIAAEVNLSVPTLRATYLRPPGGWRRRSARRRSTKPNA